MKPDLNPFLHSAALAASLVIRQGFSHVAMSQWDGGASTGDWYPLTNWSPDTDNADFKGTYSNRHIITTATRPEVSVGQIREYRD